MTVHVRITDTSFGVPAADVDVLLSRRVEDGWQEVLRGRTDPEGVLVMPPPADTQSGSALYRIECDLDTYYAVLGVVPLIARLTVEVRVEPDARLSLPLAFSAHSVLAYRGG
ncbi:hydroxyisourate hydrolase [Streptomyces sp. NPDC006997]|uniref:hydroxyisourate hydrolase n=1 Tax=Streptomyces sp. NPDC006997 TaxID=3155356 RepID=UPI0033F6E963